MQKRAMRRVDAVMGVYEAGDLGIAADQIDKHGRAARQTDGKAISRKAAM